MLPVRCLACSILERVSFFGGRVAEVAEEVLDDYLPMPSPEWFGDARSQQWNTLGSDGGPLFQRAEEV